jgi:hypothetical protein
LLNELGQHTDDLASGMHGFRDERGGCDHGEGAENAC